MYLNIFTIDFFYLTAYLYSISTFYTQATITLFIVKKRMIDLLVFTYRYHIYCHVYYQRTPY